MIRQFIEWVLNPDSRRRVEDAAKQSARKTGQEFERQTERAARESEGAFRRAFRRVQGAGTAAASAVRGAWGRVTGFLSSGIGRLATGLLGTAAIFKGFQLARDSLSTFAEAEAIWNRLAGQVEKTGANFDELEPKVRAVAADLQRRTVFGDEDFASSMQELVSITGDADVALNNVALAMDLAAAKGIDLNTATQLVGRTLIGDTALLKRYGIVVGENEDALTALQDRFQGMAENEAQTFQGRLKQLNNAWADFKEAVGGALVAMTSGGDGLQGLVFWVQDLTAWIEENREEIGFWGGVIVRTARGVAVTVGGVIRIAKNLVEAYVGATRLITATIAGTVAEVANSVIRGVNRMLDAVDAVGSILGFNVDWRINELPAEEFFDIAARGAMEVGSAAGDVWDALKNVAGGWRDVATAARGAESAQRRASRAGAEASGPSAPAEGEGAAEKKEAPKPGEAPRNVFGLEDSRAGAALVFGESERGPTRLKLDGAQLFNPEEVDPFFEALRERTESHVAGLSRSAFGVTQPIFEDIENGFAELEGAAVDLGQVMADSMSGAAGRMTDSFENVFATLLHGITVTGEGFSSLGKAALGIGASIVASLIEGLAEYHSAQGVAKLAEGTWPPNPAALFSSLKHFAAAGLFKALGAKVGEAGGAGGGGGFAPGGAAAGGTGTPRDFETRAPDRGIQERIVVYLDPFNPRSPSTQRLVNEAVARGRARGIDIEYRTN